MIPITVIWLASILLILAGFVIFFVLMDDLMEQFPDSRRCWYKLYWTLVCWIIAADIIGRWLV